MPSSRWTSWRVRSRGSTASVAPIRNASSRRNGIRLADHDEARAGVAGDGGGHQADRPGARPPARPHRGRGTRARCGPRCRTGRRSRRRPRRCRGQWCHTFVTGRTTCSANAPSRWTPSPTVFAQRCQRPARQWRHLPQTTWPSPLTMSPGWRSVTLLPTSSTSPTNSWPTTSGGWIVRCAQASQTAMCRSVPQIPVLWTRIRTSLMAIGGSGTSISSRPGPAAGLDEGLHARSVAQPRRGCRGGRPLPRSLVAAPGASGQLALGDGSVLGAAEGAADAPASLGAGDGLLAALSRASHCVMSSGGATRSPLLSRRSDSSL